MNKLRTNPETKNSGKRWNDEEDILLLQELANNTSLQEIAKTHHRTEGGIKSRISIKAVTDYENGVELETIYERYKLNEEQFQEAFEYIAKKKSEKAKAEIVSSSKEKREKTEKKKKCEEVVQNNNDSNNDQDQVANILKELLLEVREMKIMFQKQFTKSDS